MNDRFKFRAYDPVKKTYYHDFYLMSDGSGAIYTPLAEGEDENRLIIEQCTGLKDANDKLVFEGDILDVPFETFDGKSFSMRDLPCVVVHLNGFLMFQDKEGNFHYLDETEFAVFDKEFLAAEVIGNIHENVGFLCGVVDGASQPFGKIARDALKAGA